MVPTPKPERQNLERYDYDAVLNNVQEYIDLAVELAGSDETRLSRLYDLLIANRQKVSQDLINRL